MGTDRIRVKRLEALAVFGDLTSERGTSTQTRDGDRTDGSPRKRAFERLRGKDSNLDYLIQSQASYH
jgi:hypothetical protein